MSKIKKVINQSVVNSTAVDTESGEVLNAKDKLIRKESTNYITIKSDEYICFDSHALKFLCDVLGKADIAKVYRMTDMLKTECSILYTGNNLPHTTGTLAKALDICEDELRRTIKRLVKINVLAYAVCAPLGIVKKVYMLNPFVARKRKTIHCELLELFIDISKKDNQKVLKNRLEADKE